MSLLTDINSHARRASKATRDRYRKLFRKGRIRGTKIRSHPRAGEFTDQSGRIYERASDGVIRRVSPLKPWDNKAEMKQFKKFRRKLEL